MSEVALAAVLPGMHRPQRRLGMIPADAAQLVAWLDDAGLVFMSLQVRGLGPGAVRSGMQPYLRSLDPEAWGGSPDPESLPVPAPSARQISLMDEALAWVTLIPLDPARPGQAELHSRHGGAMLRRIVLSRAMVSPRTGRHVFSWRRLGDRLGCSAEGARRWHGQGIDRIWLALSRT